MSGPYKNWSVQERQRAESPRTQNARERFLSEHSRWLGLSSELSPDESPRKLDNSMRRVEPEESTND